MGPVHTGIFNLADLTLTLGLAALLLEWPFSALSGGGRAPGT
jgi:hypothetical protein